MLTVKERHCCQAYMLYINGGKCTLINVSLNAATSKSKLGCAHGFVFAHRHCYKPKSTYEVDDASGRKVLLPMVHAAAGKFQAPPLMM